jgi:F420-0:gamma-glutamyl ligase
VSTNINEAPEFRVIGLPGIGMIENGDNLVAEIGSALERNAITLEHGDVVCVAQKNYL